MAIGALFGAGASIFGAIMQAKAQKEQRDLSYMSLFEQKRAAREQEALAKATRSDAYGNKIQYRDGIGFETKTTPLTSAILSSQQKEQLAQFREDAPRARAAAERIDKRAIKAGDVFDKRFNDYEHKRRKSSDEYEADAIIDALMAKNSSKGGAKTSALARTAARSGDYNTLLRTVTAAKKAGDEGFNLSAVIADAKRGGKQQHLAEKGAEDAADFGELGQLRSIADAIVSPNLNFANENAALSGRQDQALTGLISTNAANSQRIGQAYNAVATAAGQSPNLGGVASALSRISLPPRQKEQTEDEKLLAQLLMQQKIGSARVGIANNNQSLSAFKGNSGDF